MSDAAYTLVMGDKAWSSWSLRAWLVMRRSGVAFGEEMVRLRQPSSRSALDAASPSGKVPVLCHGPVPLWDSLAIAEYMAEQAPGAHLWPQASAIRAHARAISAEMHSGFAALRQTLPMDFLARGVAVTLTEDTARDIARIAEIWTTARASAKGGGPYLFGGWSIADAMYAPVVSRFVTYSVALNGAARAYAETMMADADMQYWGAACRADAGG